MKITRRQLRQIIKEELNFVREDYEMAGDIAGASLGGAIAGAAAGSPAAPVVALAALGALVGYGAHKWLDKKAQAAYNTAIERFRMMGPGLIGPELYKTVADPKGTGLPFGTNEALLFAALERIEELRLERGCSAVKRSASFGAKHAGLPGTDEFWRAIEGDLDGADLARYKQVINAWADKGCLKWRYK